MTKGIMEPREQGTAYGFFLDAYQFFFPWSFGPLVPWCLGCLVLERNRCQAQRNPFSFVLLAFAFVEFCWKALSPVPKLVLT